MFIIVDMPVSTLISWLNEIIDNVVHTGQLDLVHDARLNVAQAC